jgi:multicomponent K+:H+ antiporter subunit A
VAVLSGSEEWFWIVGGAGACTLLLGAYCAMFQNDLKGLLAYSTISHLGLITLLLGLNSPLAAVAAVFHILNHATFKASLFMAAGIIDHESGTRDIRKLSGLFKLMPFTATLAMVASASMAGVPLLNGFLSKEMFFAETVFINDRLGRDALPVIATIAGTFSVAYSLRFTVDVFFGPTATDLPTPRTSRRAGCARRSSCWCSPAWWWASSRPRWSARCSPPPRCRWWAAPAGIQPGDLARLERADDHEPDRHVRRHRAVPAAAQSARALPLPAADRTLQRQAPVRAHPGDDDALARRRNDGSAPAACRPSCSCWCWPPCWPA